MDTSLIQNLDFSKEHPQLSEILEKFQQQVKNIYQDQLVKLILFGSQAKQQAKPDSDIDILVVLKDKLINEEYHPKIINLISDLCLEYEVLISCIYVSEPQFDPKKSIAAKCQARGNYDMKIEQQQLLEKARESLQVAKLLVDNNSQYKGRSPLSC